MQALRINREAIEQFCTQINETAPIQLVAFNEKGPSESIVLAGNDTKRANELCNKYGANGNIYYTVNIVDESFKNKKPTKADIIGLRAVWVDIDPQSDETVVEFRNRITPFIDQLKSTGAKITYAVWSGGGVQIVIFQKKPTPISNEASERYERMCNQLINALGGDPGTQNIDRLLRLPGSVNNPTASKKARGRQPCLSSFAIEPLDNWLAEDEHEIAQAVAELCEIAKAFGLVATIKPKVENTQNNRDEAFKTLVQKLRSENVSKIGSKNDLPHCLIEKLDKALLNNKKGGLKFEVQHPAG